MSWQQSRLIFIFLSFRFYLGGCVVPWILLSMLLCELTWISTISCKNVLFHTLDWDTVCGEWSPLTVSWLVAHLTALQTISHSELWSQSRSKGRTLIILLYKYISITEGNRREHSPLTSNVNLGWWLKRHHWSSITLSGIRYLLHWTNQIQQRHLEHLNNSSKL